MFHEDELAALVGHRFPGGTYRIAHWENWLLTDCTEREPMPDALVHPIALFHVPILGAGTTIGELFRLGGASGDSGSVGLLGYDWEYLRPLREEVDYAVEGGIVGAERRVSGDEVNDDVAFCIQLHSGGEVAARVTNRWRFRRAGERPAPPTPRTVPEEGPDLLPTRLVESVDPARMKTMAALLRDPYPVHWDRAANAAIGLGGRVINQGPLNLGYVANMLMDWAGPASIRRLTVSFGRPVLDGDRVIAGGRVQERHEDVVECEVWLGRDGLQVVSGRAVVEK
jgi:acyl dehydratase